MNTQPTTEPNSDIIRFETNIPVDLPGMKYPGGRPVQGRYGDQVLITFIDGRKAYVPPIVETRIQELGLRLGEPFTLTKKEVTEGRRKMIRWEVGRSLEQQLQNSIDQARKQREPQPPEPLARDHRTAAAPTALRVDQPNPTPQPAPAARPSGNGLANALRFAIDAALEATAYAQSKGLALAFDSDSIRTLAVTAFINSQGGRP